MITRNRHDGAFILAAVALASITLQTTSASAGVVFSESFEAPVVIGFDDNTVPSGGKWIGATNGFGASNRGLYNEIIAWPATTAFSTPYGAQAYYLNYSNSGLTTSVGATGQSLTADVPYKVTFNAAVTSGTASGSYRVELVAFTPAEDNTVRKDCNAPIPGTILATATGTVTTTDMSAAGSLTFTPDGANAHLGKDLGIRLIKSTNSVLYDNIRMVTGHDMLPSPASGLDMPAGNTVLSWTNMPPNTPGGNVPVDVWFGPNPAALTQVVDGVLISTTNVNAPAAGTYYWRVDSYPDGNPSDTPVTGDLFFFVVSDSDGDGLPDAYELAHTTPPNATALDPASNLDSDGLTAAQEYFYGTDPNDNDTDNDTLLDGPELTGVGSRPPTSPVDFDSDDDGLSDGVESNTGIWVAYLTDTGTNPKDADRDKDGLPDGVETKDGSFNSRTTDTGTDPYLADTDNDGAWDYYEVAATFTNPNSNTEVPSIPYPLPDPVSSDLGTTDKPVKVYIMAGQSNTVGIGYVSGGAGSLTTIAKSENKFPNLVDGSNNWTSRNDVIYKGVVSATAQGPLTAGMGADATRVGPELGFGQVMGWYHDEPVLIIKASQGNRSLGWDFLPPDSLPWESGATTYAGYGQSPQSWLTASGAPAPGGWYAGKQYDDCFRSEANMGPLQTWSSGTIYPNGCMLRHNGMLYIAKNRPKPNPDADPPVLPYVDSADSEPGIGVNSATYWDLYSTTNAADILNFTNGTLQNLPTAGNNLNGREFQVAGFCWWQGHKDHTDSVYAPRYEQNLVNLIHKLRADFQAPNAPFVVASIGFGGGPISSKPSLYQQVYNAQMAVGNPALHGEFSGTVKSVDTLPYWRTLAESPGVQDYHYNNNAETYTLVGDAMGRAMLELLVDTAPPAPNPMTFAIAPTAVNATTVGMVATTAADVSGPVQYYFENTSNGNFRNWSTDPRWDNTGLAAGSYNYRVKAKDGKGNETGWSIVIASASPGSDVTAPSPAPQFTAPLTVLGENSISMTATTASDINGVQYSFECTVGGGPNSGWQSGTPFTATGLTAGTSYTYVVRARDSLGNATGYSAPAVATTTPPDTTPPTPGTMSFATPPTASGTSNITMTAATASDPSGVQYSFEETSGNSGGTSSGWQDSPSYTDIGLQPGTQYIYRVRARDKSPAGAANNWSSPVSATTGLPDVTAPQVVSFNPADGAIDVAVSSNLVITFSEEINTGTGLITLKNLSDETQSTIDITDDAQISASGPTLTINPTTNLVPGKNYAVQIANTAIKDLSDNENPFAGISDDTTWNFTSAVVPYVWTQTAGNAQDWNTGTNWQGLNVPSPIAGDTVDFSTVNIAADTTLTLVADRTAQLWKFGDTSGTQKWVINAGNQLILAGTTPTIQVNNATTTLNNVVAGSSGLTKTGSGTLALANAANTFSGGLTVSAGNLSATTVGSLGSSGNLIKFNGNSTFTNGGTAYPHAFEFNGVDRYSASLTINGAVGGTGSLQGPDLSSITLKLLNTANTYTGSFILGYGIKAHTLEVASLSDSSGNVILGSTTGYGRGTFAWSVSANSAVTFTNRQFMLAGANNGGVIQNNNTTATNTVTIVKDLGDGQTSGSAATRLLQLGGANSGNNTFGGKITDFTGVVVSLTKADAGKWILAGANTFTGNTTINAGRLEVGGSGSLGNGSYAGNISIASTSSGTFKYNSSAVQGLSGAISGAGALAKDNSGTLTLTGPNTYTGTTTISNGKLFINGDQSTASGAVSVAANATLGGTGIIGGNTTIADTGKLEFNISTAPASHDKLELAATKKLTFSGTSVLTITSSGGASTGTYTLVTAPGAGSIISPVPAAVNVPPGWSYDPPQIVVDGPNTSLVINITSTGNGGEPEIAVDQSGNINSGDTKGFGTVTLGSNTSLVFTISNSTGTAALNLTGSPLVAVSGTNASDFSVTSLPASSVVAGGSTPFTVRFAPLGTTEGLRSAVLTIANNDSDEGTFTINVNGTAQTQYQAWANGAAFEADANDDGVKNGMAFLLGAAGPNTPAAPPAVSQSGGNLVLTFDCLEGSKRGSAALSVQHSGNLGISNLWAPAAVPGAVGDPVIVNNVHFATSTNGNLIHVVATIPQSAAASGKLFGRLQSNP